MAFWVTKQSPFWRIASLPQSPLILSKPLPVSQSLVRDENVNEVTRFTGIETSELMLVPRQ